MHTVEIILCNYCRGSGIINEETMIDYHKSLYSSTKVKCRHCNGSGRLEKVAITEIKAYTPEKWDEE